MSKSKENATVKEIQATILRMNLDRDNKKKNLENQIQEADKKIAEYDAELQKLGEDDNDIEKNLQTMEKLNNTRNLKKILQAKIPQLSKNTPELQAIFEDLGGQLEALNRELKKEAYEEGKRCAAELLDIEQYDKENAKLMELYTELQKACNVKASELGYKMAAPSGCHVFLEQFYKSAQRLNDPKKYGFQEYGE